MERFFLASVTTFLGVFISAANAQETQSDENLQSSASPPAKLLRVDDGIFELRRGKSIDLTDRKIFLTFNPRQDQDLTAPEKYFGYVLNGHDSITKPGERLDLKNFNTTSKFVEDKDSCFLDVVDLVAPKGGTAVATFRLSCD